MAIVTNDRRQGVNSSKAIKVPVYVSTTTNITLSGEQTIDGIFVTAGMRVLVKDQSNAVQNGIYEVSTGSWTRALDFDGQLDTTEGTIVFVLYGTIGTNTWWRLTTSNPVIGTSAITFLRSFIKDTISPEDFNAIGDGITDDSTALNNAMEAAVTQGAWLYLKNKIYGVSNKLVVPSGLRCMGQGCGQYPPSARITDADFEATPKTRIKALSDFPSNTPVVEVRPDNNAKYTHHGVYLQGFMIDCANVAARGLDVVSVKNSMFEDLLIFRPTSIGILEDCLVAAHSGTAQAGGATVTVKLATTASTRDDLYNGQTLTVSSGTNAGYSGTVTDYDGATQSATVSPAASNSFDATSVYSITGYATTEGINATQFNDWRNVVVWGGNTGNVIGWKQTGNPTNNINQSTYVNCGSICANGDCLLVDNADTNTWIGFRSFSFGTGVGVRLKGNEKNQNEFARFNVFLNPILAQIGGTGGVVAEAGAARNSIGNVMYGYHASDGAPPPVDNTGGRFLYTLVDAAAAGYGWRTFIPTVTFATPGDLSMAYTTQTGRFWKEGQIIRFIIQLTFTPTFTTSAGDLIIAGLPQASKVGVGLSFYPVTLHNSDGALAWTWGVGKTQISARQIPGTTTVKLLGMANGVANAFLTATEFPTGTAKNIFLSGEYEAAT